MMDIDNILKKELGNDGQSVFLFFDEFYDFYVAYGLSAYYSTMVTEPYLTYSKRLDMPVAFFDKAQIRFLRQSLEKVEHTPSRSYEFRTRIPIGESGYEKWKKEILQNHESII